MCDRWAGVSCWMHWAMSRCFLCARCVWAPRWRCISCAGAEPVLLYYFQSGPSGRERGQSKLTAPANSYAFAAIFRSITWWRGRLRVRRWMRKKGSRSHWRIPSRCNCTRWGSSYPAVLRHDHIPSCVCVQLLVACHTHMSKKWLPDGQKLPFAYLTKPFCFPTSSSLVQQFPIITLTVSWQRHMYPCRLITSYFCLK